MKNVVLIIGFGKSGRSATSLLLNEGYRVIAADNKILELQQDPEVISLLNRGVILYHESEIDSVSSFQFAILSPGISPDHPLVKKLETAGIEITSEIEIGFRSINQQVIGITGTNGKTTVTLLVSHFLNSAGKSAKALGNIGIPLAAEVQKLKKDDIIVAELSSFQLDTLTKPHVDYGIILNISHDHLDRYKTLENYAASKIHMKNLIKKGGELIVYEKTFASFPSHFKNHKCCLYGYSQKLDFSTDLEWIYKRGVKQFELPESLKGRKSHDLENFLAAFALCDHIHLPLEIYNQAFPTFKKPSHRIEYVQTINGIHFFDDSKGTNIDAVIRAVESIDSPIHLIVGGVDKGASYSPWIQVFKEKVRSAHAIGQAADKIAYDLFPHFVIDSCLDLKDAIRKAFIKAQPGETILMSPGCSSYDMFRDYVHRGEVFKMIVQEIDHEVNPSLIGVKND